MPTRLSIEPRLVAKALGSQSKHVTACKICGCPVETFDTVDFNKFCDADPLSLGESGIDVLYFKCNYCECIFTSFFDEWRTDDFTDFVYNDEYIKVDPDYAFKRPYETTVWMRERLPDIKEFRILDFGAGSGILGTLMNEFGYCFRSYDPFSSPARPEGPFDVVTAFEVIEHSPNPLETFERMLGCMPERKIVLVGQSLQPENISELRGSWWYLAPRNGHCTAYAEKTFRVIAEKFGLEAKFGSGLYGFYSDAEDELTQRVMSAVI